MNKDGGLWLEKSYFCLFLAFLGLFSLFLRFVIPGAGEAPGEGIVPLAFHVLPGLNGHESQYSRAKARRPDTSTSKKINLSIISAHLLRVSFYVPAPLPRISVRIKSYSPTAYVRGVVKNTDAELIDCAALGS